jgi:hypothetical protein
MGKQELDNLVRIGQLKKEPPSRAEYDGMVAAARTSLTDAQKDLDPDSQFTLAYVLRTGWPWRPCAAKDTDPKIGFQYSRRWFIRSEPVTPTFKSFSKRITSATLPNIKAAWILTGSFSLISSAARKHWTP